MSKPIKPCAFPGCDKLVQNHNTNCRKHKRHNFPPKIFHETRLCKQCGQSFVIDNPRAAYCNNCKNPTCVICGKTFRRRHIGDNNTCSFKCARARGYKTHRTQLVCKYCEQGFYPISGHTKQKYCSKSCAYADKQKIDIDQKRRSAAYRKWRQQVIKRDDYTCQQCGSTQKLQAHHVKSWEDFPELRYDIDNGLTLCSDCHSRIHGAKIIRTNTQKITCANCGKTIAGRGKSDFCRSCAVKFSPKAILARERLFRNQLGQYAT